MKVKLSREHIFEIVKYAGGCACSIVIKILVTALFTALAAPVWLAYLGAQLIILFFSYGFHSRVTFRRRLRGWRERIRNFLVFAGSVLIFKLADYLLVVLAVGWLTVRLERGEVLTPWLRQGIVAGAIAAASAAIFVIRYFFYRRILRDRSGEGESGA